MTYRLTSYGPGRYVLHSDGQETLACLCHDELREASLQGAFIFAGRLLGTCLPAVRERIPVLAVTDGLELTAEYIEGARCPVFTAASWI
jgi:hypothetical protein